MTSEYKWGASVAFDLPKLDELPETMPNMDFFNLVAFDAVSGSKPCAEVAE